MTAHHRSLLHPLLVAACTIIVVAALRLGAEICIPIALAVLLSFVLSPLASALEKWHFPHVLASLVVMLLMCGVIVFVGWLVTGQVIELADKLPQYQVVLHQKLESLHARPGGTLDRIMQTVQNYATEVQSLEPTQTAPASEPGTATAPAPIEVKLAKTPINGFDLFRNAVLQGLRPIVTLGVVLVLAFFILMQRGDVRDRTIRLLGRDNLHTTTQTIDDAVTRVSRYLMWQLIVNASYGVVVGLMLFWLGIPYAVLFGLFSGAMRFLPYFGVPVAAILPIGMAFVSVPGFREVLLIIGMFAVLEIGTANLIEPWLYGSRTGISPLAILVSALFWAWIWGVAGLLLSMPLTVCLATMGRHAEQLRFLSILFGDEPALKPPARFYQRLLAGDSAQAKTIAEEMLKEMPLARVFDELFLPSLVSGRKHRRLGDLDDEHQKTFRNGITALIDELLQKDAPEGSLGAKAHAEADGKDDGPVNSNVAPPSETGVARVLCFATHDFSDEAAARMVAGLLLNRNIPAESVPVHTAPRKRLELVDQDRPPVICISALSPRFAVFARQMARRLRHARHQTHILVGLWQPENGKLRLKRDWPKETADEVSSSLSEAVDRIAQRVTGAVSVEVPVAAAAR